MDFKLEFSMDNSIFEDCPKQEVKEILTRIADRVLDGQTFGPIAETNGNTIGRWSIA